MRIPAKRFLHTASDLPFSSDSLAEDHRFTISYNRCNADKLHKDQTKILKLTYQKHDNNK